MIPAPSAPYIVTSPEAGLRLDAFLARRAGLGRRGARRLSIGARVNGRIARPGQALAVGDSITLVPSEALEGSLDCLRETSEILVLNKPAGLPTVALAGQAGDSMAARIAAARPDGQWPGPPLESGIVHRLDAGTSGVLLVARDERLWSELRQQTRDRAWQKTYLSLLQGRLDETQTVDLAIGQHPKSRRRMVPVRDPAKAARYAAHSAFSRITPLRSDGAQTFVRVETRTGLRHQVRVHLASIGHPVVNDGLYGPPADDQLPGHYLHGETIGWSDPASGSRIVERAPIPSWWPEWVRSSDDPI
ncbi:MAG TPA: hypothetical protein DCG06_00135 [Deltaproteobacteria bacterium]|nr:hypothetical protein [Deltaproteobacteria bacterium]